MVDKMKVTANFKNLTPDREIGISRLAVFFIFRKLGMPPGF